MFGCGLVDDGGSAVVQTAAEAECLDKDEDVAVEPQYMPVLQGAQHEE